MEKFISMPTTYIKYFLNLITVSSKIFTEPWRGKSFVLSSNRNEVYCIVMSILGNEEVRDYMLDSEEEWLCAEQWWVGIVLSINKVCVLYSVGRKLSFI